MSTSTSASSGPRTRLAALNLYNTLISPLDGILAQAQTEARNSGDTTIASLLLRFFEPALALTPSEILLSDHDPESVGSIQTTETLMRWRRLTRNAQLTDFFNSRDSRACLNVKDILAESLEMSLHPDPDDPRMVFTLDNIATILDSLSALDDVSVGKQSVADIPSWAVSDKVLEYMDETMEETMLCAAGREGIVMTASAETIRRQLLEGRTWGSVGDKLRSMAESGLLLGDTTYVGAVAKRLDEVARSRKVRKGEFGFGKEVELHTVEEWRRMAAEMERKMNKKRGYESVSGDA